MMSKDRLERGLDMCRVKYGEAICNNEDVRNLIAGVILRQKNEYIADYIVNIVCKYLQGSTIDISRNDVSVLVDNSLDVFERNDEIICENGRYRTVGFFDIVNFRKNLP